MLQDPSSSWKTPRNTLIAICFSESVRRRVCVCVCVWGGGGGEGAYVCVCVCVCVCVHGIKGEIQDGQRSGPTSLNDSPWKALR